MCEAEELARRIAHPERRERAKSLSPEEARRTHARLQVYRPRHPNTLTLDVTHLRPEQSARAILEHVQRLKPGR